jgi:hypothetical protein
MSQSQYQRLVGSNRPAEQPAQPAQNIQKAPAPTVLGGRNTYQVSSQGFSQTTSVVSGGNTLNFEGQNSELSAESAAYLRWASELNNSTVISGSSDYSRLAALKSAILELRSHYFNPNSGLSVQGEGRDELDRRFLLIEHDLDGLLRRRIEYSAKDQQGGSRNLDFTTLLNEKEVYIVELEKRIENLEYRLRRAS